MPRPTTFYPRQLYTRMHTCISRNASLITQNLLEGERNPDTPQPFPERSKRRKGKKEKKGQSTSTQISSDLKPPHPMPNNNLSLIKAEPLAAHDDGGVRVPDGGDVHGKLCEADAVQAGDHGELVGG